ncbi:MAG: metal-dependent hydrolase [Candidatus Izimaplasma sp.]|nr:metal-dependent hydrolase [Candidatus Izimaplasma bacterium]
MKCTFLGHAAVLIEALDYKIIIDPFLKHNPLYKKTDDDTVGITHVLITHAHGDHIGDAVEIAQQNNAVIICNFEISSILKSIDKSLNIHPMHLGGRVPVDFGTVKMTPALHGSGYIENDMIYDGGSPCGFLLKVADKTIYHAGDTGLTYDMKLLENSLIDLAFLPIGGNYTMDVDDAVIAVDFIKPNKVVPIHYNTFDLIQADPKDFKNKVSQAEVIILDSGDSIDI